MSLEYAIEYPCEMRREYDEASLRAIGRTGSLVSRLVSQTIDRAATPTEESILFTQRFEADLERAEQIAAHCRAHCPANLDRGAPAGEVTSAEPIGCLGRINYPIDARFEHFLADRIQLLYDTNAPDHWPRLLHVLLDAESPFDGEATKELRRVTTAEGLRFFERRAPIALSRHAGRLTTDHIFDLLAGFAASDGGAAGYQRELPVLALGDYSELLEAALTSEISESEVSRLHLQSPTYTQYRRFTQAVRVAHRLGIRLLLD